MLLNVALLAGGQSRQFGSDKALAVFRGKPIIEYISEKYINEGFNVSVISKDVSKYLDVLSGSLQHVEDIYEQHSPLSGIITALMHYKSPVFIVSAYTPSFPSELIRSMFSVLGDYDAVVPRFGDKSYPLLSVYASKCHKFLVEQFNLGNYGILNSLKSLNTFYLEEEFFLQKGYDRKIFTKMTSK